MSRRRSIGSQFALPAPEEPPAKLIESLELAIGVSESPECPSIGLRILSPWRCPDDGGTSDACRDREAVEGLTEARDPSVMLQSAGQAIPFIGFLQVKGSANEACDDQVAD